MADGSPRIGFRPLTGADLTMLGQWMERPHWRQWWGEPQAELALVRDMVEGRDATRPFVILLDGEPAGYIQVWFIGRHQDPQWTEDHPWLADLPPETVGVDLSLADETMLSRGIGSAALRAFVGELLAEGHGRIIIDPDPSNGRAVRAYEKAGFRPIPQLLGRTGDALIMQYEGPNA
ncbi:MAG: N-acetyltransferase [Alphaproteobacteria bacterium]|nr:MAG: N-acetyltransferase [Alphaproteobacteria bacterium]